MNCQLLMLRLGEITLKGRNRARFEKAVLSHVKSVLEAFPKARITKDYGRIYIELCGEPAGELIPPLKKVFGITAIVPVAAAPSELEAIQQAALDFIGSLSLEKETAFKVNSRRVWKEFPYSSQEMNKLVSSPLLQQFSALKVDVNHPELELRVEVRQERTLLYSLIIPGAGGFPLGTNGKAMLLLSGGIDSPVAGWSAMRRGLEIECVHFHSYPFTSRKAEEKVIELAKVLSGYSGTIKLHLVPFTDIQTAFTGVGQDNLIITFMRRAMLRIATRLAEASGALAIVTGESLGQVASQTLPSMNVIGRATELPLLRPLVMMDKDDIISLSQQIGTYELSILPYEDCCTLFIPKSPSTNPNLRIVQKVEQHVERLDEMIELAVQNTVTLNLTPHAQIRYEEEGGPEEASELPRHDLELPLDGQAIREDWF
ncbi:tRNA uracil 4-sulfurtransferase ThiI [Paenibacillus pinistramenti]|uniref:tRNA uracil 4-sulfurtransferase ThiI n=1 Tax=Paenibacillus pinistramenti TaxID=1768003 RepID=UPI0011082311|nr:tRNA uracil 4-sulfurtransferase ThiI [Paenibacillus pinistramenti]